MKDINIKIFNTKYQALLIIIILIAAAARLILLDKFPNGFTGDEAQQGYSAYSILQTGKDEWGQVLPLFPRGFGDFKPPLYTYLSVPSVALFGLSVEAVRFPASIVGILTVVVLFFLTAQLLKDERIALWSSFLLAINPWHIQISRTAWEGGLGILTFSLALLFYLRSGLKNFVLAAFFLGLTLYSYHSWRIFVILFVVGVLVIYGKKLQPLKNWIAGIVLLVFTIPLFLNLNSVFTRSSDVGIFSPKVLEGYFVNKGVSSLPPALDRLLDNKALFVASEFSGNYFSYFSPTFFFSHHRPDNTYLNFPYYPLLYIIEIIFWLTTIYILICKRLENKKLILLWFIFAAIPASLTTGAMNANRSSTFLPLTAIISAIGADFILTKFRKSRIWIALILIFSTFTFLHFYFITLPQKQPQNLRYGYDKVFEKVIEQKDRYDEIVLSKVFSEPQIFIAFYGKMDPVEFQQASQDWLRYEKSNKLYVDQLESWNLGKFYFEDINWAKKDSLRKNALIISKPEDFPKEVESIYDIRNPKGQILFKMIPVKNK